MQFEARVLHSCLPLHSYVTLGFRFLLFLPAESKYQNGRNTKTEPANRVGQTPEQRANALCHLVYACFSVSLALEQSKPSLPVSIPLSLSVSVVGL